MICGGGVAVAGGWSEGGMLAVDFRLPNPKPLKREFREFIREEKERKGEDERSQVGGGMSEVEEGKTEQVWWWIEGRRGGLG